MEILYLKFDSTIQFTLILKEKRIWALQYHVYKLIFNCQMESKIGEANSHLIIFGWCEYSFMAIPSQSEKNLNLFENPGFIHCRLL